MCTWAGLTNPKMQAALFRRSDTDGDQKIDFVEMMLTVCRLTGSKSERLVFMFEAFNKNSDGVLSRRELEEMFEAGGEEQAPAEAALQVLKAVGSGMSGKESVTREAATSGESPARQQSADIRAAAIDGCHVKRPAAAATRGAASQTLL